MPTANPEKGEIEFVINGRPYVLVMTFNGMIDLQNLFATGGPVPKVEQILGRCADGELAAVRGVFWSLLRRHHPQVTIEEAGDLIQEAGGSRDIDALLAKAGAASGPDPRDIAALGGAAANPPKRKRATRGTGARLN